MMKPLLMSYGVIAVIFNGCFEEPRFERLNDEPNPLLVNSRDMSIDLEGDQEVLDMSAGEQGAGEYTTDQMMEAGTEQGGGELLVGPEEGSIIGTWLSEGNDVAPLLREPPLNLSLLEAHFNPDLTFIVQITNTEGESFSLSGEFSVPMNTTDGNLYTIVLSQNIPEASISEGIWRVDGETMTYEVVQTQPALPGDNSPPSIERGFGSTNNGALGSDNVQLYRRKIR